MSKVKIGIIGVGNISESHIQGYLKNENVELYAFCDINAQRLAEKGKKYGVTRLFTSVEEMVALPELDGVSVCVWNCNHYACTMAALRAGKHVLCEKPLAMNAAQAQEMLDFAKEQAGALGLESASRGAAEILMVELSPKHISVIENNIRIVQKTGAMAAITLINADVLDLPRYSKRISHADFIFADPPYAVSGELFKKLLALPRFREDFAGAQLFWEIPDTPGAAGDFINCPALKQWQLKDFAGTRFLVGTVAELP